MKIIAPAKLNLCLDVLKKDASGYHQVWTIFQETNQLCDELEIFETQEDDKVSTSDGVEINLVTRAIKLVKKFYVIDKCVEVKIKKGIPFSSGLGGVSSDAAATLKGLSELWGLKLSKEALVELAAHLGSDVAFFINGGTALGSHYGEHLTPLKPIKGVKFEIQPQETWPAFPDEMQHDFMGSKTKSMYESLDLSKCGKEKGKTEKILLALESGDAKGVLENLHNDFETILAPPKGLRLSGSGPAIFKASLT